MGNLLLSSNITTTLITSIVKLLAGLGAFLIAVKIMSDTMNQLTGVGLKRMFQRMEKNKLFGVGIGFGTTALIQSSGVTTVMVIGLVNAGVMSLAQATAVIMGANIGTTVTAQLSALGTSFDFMLYVTIITLLGFLWMSFAKTERWRNIAYLVSGLGLVILSMGFMTDAMEPLSKLPQVSDFLAGITNPFVLIVIGVVITVICQSSSAVTSILIAMIGAGIYIGGKDSNGIIFIILGSNIGSCCTALLATFGANTNAKRAALIHLLFNTFGSVLFGVICLIWKSFMADTFAKWFATSPTFQIAMFHTFFNTVCTLIFLPFTNVFVKLATLILPDKKSPSERKLKFIDERFMSTPSIAIQLAKNEARHIGDLVMETCDIAIKGFMTTDTEVENKIAENLQEVQLLNQKLVAYLVKIAAKRTTSTHSEATISSLYYVIGDLLRVGDLSTNITKYTRRVKNGDVTFSQSVYPEIENMYQKVRDMYKVAIDCFVDKNFDALPVVEQQEEEIDQIRKQLVNQHIERLNQGECNPASNGVFINLVGNIERMADHITFIAESITKHPDEA